MDFMVLDDDEDNFMWAVFISLFLTLFVGFINVHCPGRFKKYIFGIAAGAQQWMEGSSWRRSAVQRAVESLLEL